MPEDEVSVKGSDEHGGRGGQGGRDGGRGGRGRGRGGGAAGEGRNSQFEGQEPLLKQCTFDYSEDPQAKRYLKNVELLVGFVGNKYNKYNTEFQKAIESLSLTMPAPIKELKAGASNVTIKKWEMLEKKRDDPVQAYESFLSSLFSLLLGQCTELLKDKLKAHADFEKIQQDRDGIALLKLIRQTTFTYDSKQVKSAHAIDEFKYEFYTLRRHPGQPLHEFYEVFKAQLKVCKEIGIEIYKQSQLEEVAKENSRMLATANDADKTAAHERAAAMRFIRASGSREYEVHLQNKYLDGEDIYPTTLVDARAIIDNRVQAGKRQEQQENSTGVAFVSQSGKEPPKTSKSGATKTNMNCMRTN